MQDLKTLGRENRGWRLNTASAKVIIDQLAPDESAVLVLPMRDVWRSGDRVPGMKPTVCLTDRRLIAVTHPGLLGRARCEVVDRRGVTALSKYEDRSFCLILSDGEQVKLRGPIGERRVDQMTERLYAALQTSIQ